MLEPLYIGILILLAIWILICSKSSRSDGTLIKKVHPYRNLMGYVYPSRDASVVYFDADVNAEKLLECLEKRKDECGAGLTHFIVYACKLTLEQHPEMNIFYSSRRLYRRNGVHVTFSVKRSLSEKKSKLSVVKLNMGKFNSFKDFCEGANSSIKYERTTKVTSADKEHNFLTALPRFILEPFVKLVAMCDFFNLLPSFFIKGDGLFSSLIVTNLGSLGMDPGYHHLYDWGNCSHFVMAGKVVEKPVAVNGKVSVQKILPLRIAYDERIDDGMTASQGLNKLVAILENPEAFIV